MELIVPYLFFILITIIILVVQFFVDSSIRKYIHYGYIFILLTSQITFYSILASNKCKVPLALISKSINGISAALS